MTIKTVDIPMHTAGDCGNTAVLTIYLPDDTSHHFKGRRPLVIVLPGGAYVGLAAHEGEPVALRFVGDGMCAAVLRYSVSPARFPQALCEVLSAVRYIRLHAEEFGVQADNISVLGFSAGGHLAASAGTLWNHPCLAQYLPGERKEYRPDKMLLCYPVLVNEGPHHQGSFDFLLGTEEGCQTPEMLRLTCLDYQVNQDTVPAFLWHTFEDTGVPPVGTIRFARAMKVQKRPFEMHIYPHGGHGWGMGTLLQHECDYSNPLPLSDWVHHAARFLFDTTLC